MILKTVKITNTYEKNIDYTGTNYFSDDPDPSGHPEKSAVNLEKYII